MQFSEKCALFLGNWNSLKQKTKEVKTYGSCKFWALGSFRCPIPQAKKLGKITKNKIMR